MVEKRTETLPVIRIEETLLNALLRSAAADDRSLTEYVRRVLWKHEFGHARTVGEDGEAVTDFGALHGDARPRKGGAR